MTTLGCGTKERHEVDREDDRDWPTLDELERVYTSLSDAERVDLLEALLVACALGWPEVVEVLESYVLDHEVRATINQLPEV